MGFTGVSDGKESACDARDLSLIPGLERSPVGGHGNLLQYSCQENPHGQRSLADSSPWGRKESVTTERLSTTLSSRVEDLMMQSDILPNTLSQYLTNGG